MEKSDNDITSTGQSRQRAPNYHKLVPLVYAPLMPLIRIGLNGRVSNKVRDGVFFGAVLTALCHAGYIMGKDSTMSAGT